MKSKAKFKKNKNWILVAGLILCVASAIFLDWPGGIQVTIPKPKIGFQASAPFVSFKFDGNLIDKKIDLDITKGLDIQGGSKLIYSIDMSKISEDERSDALDSLQKVIENRINAYGVSEPTIYTSVVGTEYRLTVELAGVSDIEAAKDLIGQTAELVFKTMDASTYEFVESGLTGSDLTSASVAFDQTTNQPYVAIQFTSEGAEKFATLTANNIGSYIGIYLDDTLVSYPTVNEAITGGNAQISGDFTYTEARDLAIQLDAGRLPMPISLISEQTVEASLGQDSINRSVFAGILGIIVVCIFMIIYYRLLGVFSTIGLGIYLVLTIAIFKIIGVTLTMGGVAALVLSIGMSMETDVLVFERIREEMRNGRAFGYASKLGFNRAWTSIRDSNMVSLIICALLILAGGSVRGFAIVLALGVVIGLITTFIGTRALISLIANHKIANNNWLFHVEKTDESN